MLNNIRICPTCRSPLPSNTCKKCGYKQKILKVAQFQEEFGKINYANKIQTSNRESKSVRFLTSQEKLAIYLKQYQKLVIKAVKKIIEGNQLNIRQRQQLRSEVKYIWQGYLLKIRNNSSQSLGMLKKQSSIQPNYQNKQNLKIQEVKQIKEGEQENQEWQAQQVSPQNGQKKRRKASKLKQVQKKQITLATQLRCYITQSVRPLMKESIQLRKGTSNELTLAQKSFLSFLLGLKNIDQSFIGVARNKYLKLILEIDGNKLQKSFVKQSIISTQLQRRKLRCSKDRSKALNLILLYDILQCQLAASLCYQKIDTIQQLIKRYPSSSPSQIIEFLRALVNREKQKEEQNVPEISYQLIYSIMYLSTCRLGLTISIGEIMASVGALQIAKINIEQDLFLPALLNQEAITSPKIRRTAHLLAKYLNLTFPVVINRWCIKWCSKFDILAQLPKISALNRTIFKQVFIKGFRKRSNNECTEKYLNYYRFYQLQQDIASLSSLLVYVKLIDGLSDYPYLMNINVDLLKKEYSLDGELLSSIEKLMKNKKINLQNTVTKQVVTKVIPEIYQQSFDLLKFTKKITQINKNDKFLGAKMMNNDLINFRNLSHLNEVPSLTLLEIFKRFKSIKDQKQSDNQIKLRYNQMPHQQWTIQLAKSRKIKPGRIVRQRPKPKAIFCEDLIKQMNCIINEDQILANEQGIKSIECLLDEPSTNYELMYEYSSDTLTLVQRCQQLHLMQQLCLNVCSYNELACWLNTYESILKTYQTK